MLNSFHTGFAVIVSAPSGAGKSTICHLLQQRSPEIFVISRSCTTRPKRSSDADDAYYFTDEKSFRQRIEQQEFMEWALVHQNYYGTLKSEVDEPCRRNQIVLLDIDVQGAAQIMKGNRTFPSIFVLPPSWSELERRLRNRGSDADDQIALRLNQARQECQMMDLYGYVVVNSDVESTYQIFLQIIQSETYRHHHIQSSFFTQFQ